jgi:hypothetical protein
VFSQILVEFLFRLTFGVATAMAITPSRWVTSGFFRVHLWVLLGVQTLAALALSSATSSSPELASIHRAQFWLAIGAAVASYVGAVIWMYEVRLAGKLAIWIVAACSLAGCALPVLATTAKPVIFQLADRVTGGLLLGLVTTAMLLGHWYLNTPTMKLEPLKRLIVFLGIVVGLRMAIVFGGAWLEATTHLATTSISPTTWGLFLSLRWLAGLVGVLMMAWLTWLTLKIPNTQSATGILYAGVILAFIGELTSQLLSAEALYPV